jgi:hypothetical protein
MLRFLKIVAVKRRKTSFQPKSFPRKRESRDLDSGSRRYRLGRNDGHGCEND